MVVSVQDGVVKGLTMKYMISDHAKNRFYERFFFIPDDIESVLQDTVQFGGQIGNEYYLLNSKHKIVFPVSVNHDTKEHWVKTTLTYDQAMGNMSVFCKLEPPIETTEQVWTTNENGIPVPPLKEIPEIIQKLAMDLMVSVNFVYPNCKEHRDIENKIRETVLITRKQFKDLFWPEVGKIVHEYHNKCGRFAK